MFAATALKTQTTNGAVAYSSTASHNLDFFVKLGDPNYSQEAILDFRKAYLEDKDLAIRNLLNSRDIRQGKGIRNSFNLCMIHLAHIDIDVFLKTNLLSKIVELGYYPDLFNLVECDVDLRIKKKIIRLLAEHLKNPETQILVAKWLPLKGNVASMLRSYLKVTPKELRQLIVPLRAKVTERLLCEHRIAEIDYSTVPSKAFNRYKNTFLSKDSDRFNDFINKVSEGTATLNSSTLFLHEISEVYSILGSRYSPYFEPNPVVEAQWNSFPNLIKEGLSILPVVDLSGSMEAPAVGNATYKHIAITLGAYISERIEGPFKNLVTTFADHPSFVDLKDCKTLKERYDLIAQSQVGYSTNVEGVFKLLLDLAVSNNISSDQLPEYLVFFSDTQFNFNSRESSAYVDAQVKFKEAGLKCPKLIFWVLNTPSNNNFPVKYDESGACLLSSFSPSLLKAVCSNNLDEFSPEAIMKETLLVDRYTLIKE